jgi:hypothetical protein
MVQFFDPPAINPRVTFHRLRDVKSAGGEYERVCYKRPIVCAKLASLGHDLQQWAAQFHPIPNPQVVQAWRPNEDKKMYPQVAFAQKRFREIASANPEDTWTILDAWSRPEGSSDSGALGPRDYVNVGLPYRYEPAENYKLTGGPLPTKEAFIAMYANKPHSPPEQARGAICQDARLFSDCESGFKCDTSRQFAVPPANGRNYGVCRSR